MKDLRQSTHYAEYMRLLGWGVVDAGGVYCYFKKLPFIGSIAKIQRGEKRLTREGLIKLVKNSKAFLVMIEAKDSEDEEYYLTKLNFKKLRSSSLPSKTVQIGLQKKEQELLSEMHHKSRYNIKVAKRNNVIVKSSNDIQLYNQFWHKCAKDWGMTLSLKKEIDAIYNAFGPMAKLQLAYKNNELLGGLLLVNTPEATYYMYAASSKDGKKYYAPTLLVWEAIKYAKKEGGVVFDFEGIYDSRFPLKAWKGFSRFKQSFGGDVVVHPGSIRRYFFPWSFGLK